MEPTIDKKKRKILTCILKYYENSMNLLTSRYRIIKRVECERTRKSINSAIAFLCRNLAQVIVHLEDILTSTPDNESFILEDFISEIHFVAILLRSPVQGNIGELIDNVITTVENISAKVLKLLNKINSNVYEFTEFEFQLLEIVFEVGSANIKLLVFTTGLLDYEYLIANYKPASEMIFFYLNKQLLKNDHGLLDFMSIRYIKCSFKFLNNYLEYIQKTIIGAIYTHFIHYGTTKLQWVYQELWNANILKILQQLPNTLAKVRDLLDTVSEYIIFHISTLSDVIHTDSSANCMFINMKPLENRFFIILHWINYKLRLKSTDIENEELMHQGVLAFAEIMQSMSVIFEILNSFMA